MGLIGFCLSGDWSWTQCFLDRHDKQLGAYWSPPLDSHHGQAVNENTHKAWCNLLKKTLDDNQFEEDCCRVVDETGSQPGIGQKQRDGNKKMIAVMVTIRADETTIPPTRIYKS